MTTCRPGSAPPHNTPNSSDARTPVEIQNATNARSRWQDNAANNASNIPSGIGRGIRALTRGRYTPARSPRKESIGLWWACPRPARANGKGFTNGPVPACRWHS